MLIPIVMLIPVVGLAAPQTPSNLQLVADTTTVQIRWQDNANNETGFKIFRDDKLIAIVPANITSYKDHDLLPSTTYRYMVKATDDEDIRYMYQEDEIEVDMVDNRKHIGIWRRSDSHDLINAYEGSNFVESVNDNLTVTYNLIKEIGGFDIEYTIKNNSIDLVQLPILQIPGIQFGDTNHLKILNPLFKHYLEERDFDKEANDKYEVDSPEDIKALRFDRYPMFSVASVRQSDENGENTHNRHSPYGAQFVYSPVIVAHNDNFVVGSSLQFDQREKSDLKTYMYIEKKGDNWVYKYDLRASQLEANKEINITISVRFSDIKNWIFTLYPYKEFFNNTYKTDKNQLWSKTKDVRPIQAFTFSSPEKSKNAIRNEGRQWFWGLPRVGNTHNETGPLDLDETLKQLGTVLYKKNYKRAMIWDFTGTYKPDGGGCKENDVTYKGCIQEQLPFQFLDDPRADENILTDSFAKSMKEIINNEHNNEIDYLKSIGLGYDWGISGSMPVESDGTTLGYGTDDFQADHLAPFSYGDEKDNPNYINYANHYLNRVKRLKGTLFYPKFIRLDALNRMELSSRLRWLSHIKEALPDSTLATESSIDYMHALVPMINQLDTTESPEPRGTFEENKINQPDYLAQYLNPGVENIVNLDTTFLKNYLKMDGDEVKGTKKDGTKENEKYITELIKNGYTPLIKQPDVDFDVNLKVNIENCMLDNTGNKNLKANHCFDGNLDNGEWPYGEKCRP